MAKDLQIIRESLHKVGQKYILALQQELEFQKHISSGNLAESFFTRVHKARGSLIMDVMNNTPYMWIVNNGSSPFEPSYNDIAAWVVEKGFSFENKKHKHNVVAHIVSEIASSGLPTPMGKLVSSRRKFFIESAFQMANSSGLQEAMEQDILRQIDKEIGEVGKSKAIQLTIS